MDFNYQKVSSIQTDLVKNRLTSTQVLNQLLLENSDDILTAFELTGIVKGNLAQRDMMNNWNSIENHNVFATTQKFIQRLNEIDNPNGFYTKHIFDSYYNKFSYNYYTETNYQDVQNLLNNILQKNMN